MDFTTNPVAAPKAKAAESLRVLMAALIDYAGLFPPAGLAMQPAVANYARYRDGQHVWALGRFIVPAARLDEFAAALPPEPGIGTWPLSALLTEKFQEELRAIERINKVYSRHSGQTAMVDTVEVKASSPDEIERIAAAVDRRYTVYVEIPVAEDPRPLLAAIADAGLRAKIRTGGLVAAAFPPLEQVSRFIAACEAEYVPFKATAGLHHPLRCVRPFTYEKDSPSGTMHGFLNVFIAAAFALHGMPAENLGKVLAEEGTDAFHFAPAGLSWRSQFLTNAQLTDTRASFAIAFGSCSFEEPLQDLEEIDLL